MVVVKIENGMGNQLFNYAFGYMIARMTNEPLRLDTSGCDNVDDRPYMLDKFLLAKHERESFSNKTVLHKIYKRLRKLIKYSIVKEKRDGTDIERACKHTLRPKYLDGYWEAVEYFMKYRDELLTQIKPAYSFSKVMSDTTDYIKAEGNVCAVHMRGTDRGMLPSSFFEKAMNKVKERHPNAVFLIFTDDIDKAKETLTSINMEYTFISDYGEFSDIDEFFLMSVCKYQIVPESTFSLWAALINQQDGHEVVAKDLHSEKRNHRRYPSDWILV